MDAEDEDEDQAGHGCREAKDRDARAQAGGLTGLGHDLGRGRLPRLQGGRERIAPGQRGRDRECRRRAPGRIELKAPQDGVLDSGVEVSHVGRGALGRGLPALPEGGEGPRVEGALPREDLVEHEAQRVDVASRRHLAPELLGRHVGRRAAPGVVLGNLAGRGRKAEVRDHDLALPVEHHVRGLEVAVKDAPLVGGGQPRADPPRHVEGLVGR